MSAYEPFYRQYEMPIGFMDVFVWRAVNEIPFNSLSMNMLESRVGFVAHGMTLAPLAGQGDRISE